MSVDLKQNGDGSMGLAGVDAGDGGFMGVGLPYTATIANGSFFVADRTYIVKGIRGRVDVAGTGGACTAVIRKAPSGTAGASGTALHTGSFNLVGTANTNQVLTLSTTEGALRIAAGDCLFFNLTGTPTSAVGNVTLTLAPA